MNDKRRYDIGYNSRTLTTVIKLKDIFMYVTSRRIESDNLDDYRSWAEKILISQIFLYKDNKIDGLVLGPLEMNDKILYQ